MLTQVEIKTTAFPALPDESELINPGRFGKRLAEHLSRELEAQGYDAQDLVAEDWGWMLPLANAEFPLWLGIGNVDDSMDQMLVFIEPSSPTVRKLPFFWRSIDTTQVVDLLQQSVDRILRSHAEISNVQWTTQ